MKKSVCIGIVAFTLLISQAVSAQEPEGNTVWDGFSGFFSPDWEKDFSVSVGVKVWFNEWRRDAFSSSTAVTDTPDGQQIVVNVGNDLRPNAESSDDIEATPIPQFGLRYKWLILTGSYYPETDFHFDTTTSGLTIDVDGATRRNFRLRREADAERSEWDVSAGVKIHRYIAILGGYKKIKRDVTFTSTIVDTGASNIDRSETETEGPTVGIAASVPIGQGMGVYLSYAHGFMDVKFRTSNDLTSASYDVAEAGISYSHGMDYLPEYVPLSAATIYAGYRWQNFETDSDPAFSADRSDTTKGFTAGVNLSF